MSNLVQFFRKWASEREAHQQKEKKTSLMPTAEPLKKTEEFGSAIDRNIVTPKAIVPSSITTKPTETRRPSAAPSSGIKAVSAPVNNPGLRKRATGVYDVDGNEFVNLDDVELLGKLGYTVSREEYSVLEKTSEALDLYSYVEKIAGVPKEVSKAVDRKEAFSGEFLKDMNYNVPKGYEVKGDLVCPLEKEAANRWEKELLNMPKEKALPLIVRMALRLPGLKNIAIPANAVEESERLLMHLIKNPSEKTTNKELVLRLKEALRDSRIVGEKNNIEGVGPNSYEHKDIRKRKMLLDRKAKAQTEDIRQNIHPDTELDIVHGGGKDYLNRFLTGKEKGYSLPRSLKKGLQVHRHDAMDAEHLKDKTQFYADRATNISADTPAMLVGKIKAKHLFPGGTGYENSLTSAQHIISPKVIDLPQNISTSPLVTRPELIGTTIPIRTPEHSKVKQAEHQLDPLVKRLQELLTKRAAHELKSTNIKSVDYNKENKSLDVEFHSGGTYTYKDVPKSLFDRIRKVKSPGKFFHKHIKKDNKFEYNKLEKEANYQWYMSKPLSERLTAGRPYPFSYLTGETKELIDAVKNRDWENFKEEIGDTTFGAQMLLAQATGLNHPVYADLSKAWAREKVWKDMFGEKGGVYHPDHMRGGSNYAKASKILKAFQSAGIKMDQKEAERLANKYTGGKMEKESAAKRDWYSIPEHVREAIIRAKKGGIGAKKDLSDIGYAGGKASARKKQADSLRKLINKGDELPPKQAFEARSMHPGTLGDFAGTTIFGKNYIPRPLEGEDMVDAFDRLKRQRQTYNLAGQFVGNHPLTQKLGLGGSMLAKTIGGLSTLSPAIGGLLNPVMGNVPQASKTLVDMMNNPSIMSQFKR